MRLDPVLPRNPYRLSWHLYTSEKCWWQDGLISIILLLKFHFIAATATCSSTSVLHFTDVPLWLHFEAAFHWHPTLPMSNWRLCAFFHFYYVCPSESALYQLICAHGLLCIVMENKRWRWYSFEFLLLYEWSQEENVLFYECKLPGFACSEYQDSDCPVEHWPSFY